MPSAAPWRRQRECLTKGPFDERRRPCPLAFSHVPSASGSTAFRRRFRTRIRASSSCYPRPIRRRSTNSARRTPAWALPCNSVPCAIWGLHRTTSVRPRGTRFSMSRSNSPCRLTHSPPMAAGFPPARLHLQQVQAHLGFRAATPLDLDALQMWLVERALEHEKPTLLLQLACDKLRREQIVRPGLTRLERFVATARQQAHEETWHRLTPLVTEARCSLLDGLLVSDPRDRPQPAPVVPARSHLPCRDAVGGDPPQDHRPAGDGRGHLGPHGAQPQSGEMVGTTGLESPDTAPRPDGATPAVSDPRRLSSSSPPASYGRGGRTL